MISACIRLPSVSESVAASVAHVAQVLELLGGRGGGGGGDQRSQGGLERGAMASEDVARPGLGGEVVELAGIAREVEGGARPLGALLVGVLDADHLLVLLDDAQGRGATGIAAALEGVDRAVLGEREDRRAEPVLARLSPGELGQGAREVEERDGPIDAARAEAGAVQEERDAQLLLVDVRAVEELPVLAEGLAMVAREEEGAVPEEAARLELVEDLGEPAVEVPRGRAVVAFEHLDELRHPLALLGRVLALGREAGVLVVEGPQLPRCQALEPHGRARLLAHVVVPVRAVGLHEQEHGPPVVGLEERAHALGGLGELALHLVEALEALVHAEGARHEALVRDRAGPVPEAGEELGQGEELARDRAALVNDPGLAREEAREERGVGGQGVRRRGPGVREEEAPRRELVQERRQLALAAIGGEVVRAEGVREEDDQVARRAAPGPRARRALLERADGGREEGRVGEDALHGEGEPRRSTGRRERHRAPAQLRTGVVEALLEDRLAVELDPVDEPALALEQLVQPGLGDQAEAERARGREIEAHLEPLPRPDEEPLAREAVAQEAPRALLDGPSLLAHLELEPLGRLLARGVHEDPAADDREGARRELERQPRILREPERELALLVAQAIRCAVVRLSVPVARDRLSAAAQGVGPGRERRGPCPLLPACPGLAPEFEGEPGLAVVRREEELALVGPGDVLLPDGRERARHRGQADPARNAGLSLRARREERTEKKRHAPDRRLHREATQSPPGGAGGKSTSALVRTRCSSSVARRADKELEAGPPVRPPVP